MPRLNPRYRSACRGGSVLETMLVLALVTVLALVALDRSITLRVQAERTALEGVVQSLRSAALGRGIQQRVTGERGSAANLPGTNPMLWLTQPPRNYLGELAGPDPAIIPGGQWYFDSARRLLVYRVDYEAYFDSPLPGAARARFKIGMDSAATDRDGHIEHGTDAVRDITIEAVEPYTWRRHPASLSALKIWGVLGASP